MRDHAVVYTSAFRRFIALLTAVCIPLCCCSLDSLFRVCNACDGEHSGCHATHAEDCDESEPASTSTHERQPAHKHDVGGCKCGNDKKIGAVEGKTQHSFQPLMLAHPLPELARSWPEPGPLVGFRPQSRGPVRPDQTLLRQHCALIV
jgi:hypothetical protein